MSNTAATRLVENGEIDPMHHRRHHHDDGGLPMHIYIFYIICKYQNQASVLKMDKRSNNSINNKQQG